MTENHIFYVYEHWRPDTGTCFYVGKGKDKRAWDMKNMRNRHHMAITSKLTSLGFCVDVRIVIDQISEETALNLEIDRIATYGMDSLSNMTSGGDGLRNPSKETREKISQSQKARFAKPGAKDAVSRQNKGRVTSKETKLKLAITSKGHRHSIETIEKMKVAAKVRGVSDITRKANKAVLTGKKRAPFTEETRKKMSDASKIREQSRREARAS
jgi:hypothetical protein